MMLHEALSSEIFCTKRITVLFVLKINSCAVLSLYIHIHHLMSDTINIPVEEGQRQQQSQQEQGGQQRSSS